VRVASMPAKPGPKLFSVLLITAALCAFSGLANAGALYKWIDEDGKIRYSDRLPAAQAKKKHQQLSTQGMVLSTTEAAKSEAELAAKLKLAEEQAAEAELNKEQNKKDQVLLLTFSNEKEIGLAHDDRIEVLDSVIQLINKSLLATQTTLGRLQTSAEQNYLSKGKEVPGGLAQKIEHFARKMELRGAQLDLKMIEKVKFNARYEADLARFRLLKAEAN
jgi:hypothetical protein